MKESKNMNEQMKGNHNLQPTEKQNKTHPEQRNTTHNKSAIRTQQ